MREHLAGLASFWWAVAKWQARELWDSLPGPWYVKALIIVICLAIPGQVDEIAIVAVTAAWRKYRTRRAARLAAGAAL
jgi:hypothetical protein